MGEKGRSLTEEYQNDLIFSKTSALFPSISATARAVPCMYAIGTTPSKATPNIACAILGRDRKSGRIWRIVPKGAKLQDPPKIDGASVEDLVKNLERREYRYRYWSKRELKKHDSKK